MLNRILFTLMIALMTTGCSSAPRYVDYFPYHDDGRSKPCVALLPMFDCTDPCLPWNVAQELTCDMRFRCMDHGELYLLNPNKVDALVGNLKGVDFFDRDLSFAKQFCDCEFLVVMELIEHRQVVYEMGTAVPVYPTRNGKCNSVLSMKVRLKIVDLRCDEPTVLWQEIVHSNHMIPRDLDCYDYEKNCLGTKSYARSPYGLAHQRLADNLVQRIESITCRSR